MRLGRGREDGAVADTDQIVILLPQADAVASVTLQVTVGLSQHEVTVQRTGAVWTATGGAEIVESETTAQQITLDIANVGTGLYINDNFIADLTAPIVVPQAGATLTQRGQGAHTLLLSADISGTGGLDIAIGAGNTLTLTGEFTCTGQVTVTSGTVDVSVLGQNAAFSAAIVLADGVIVRAARSPADILSVRPDAPDGVYYINWGDGGHEQALWCDMQTVFHHPDGDVQGFAACIKWDRDNTTVNQALHADAGRVDHNVNDLAAPFTRAAVSASIDMRRATRAGATLLAHQAFDNAGVNRARFFSEIYQHIRDNPDDIFDPAFDTNANAGAISGTVVSGSEALRNRWFTEGGAILTRDLNDAVPGQMDFYIDGGEGRGMWTNGKRNGATYSSANASPGTGHGWPHVQWGFLGQDGSVQDYGAAHDGTPIGTACGADFYSERSGAGVGSLIQSVLHPYNLMLIYVPAANP